MLGEQGSKVAELQGNKVAEEQRSPDQATVDTAEKTDNNENQQPNTEISSMEITPAHPVYVEDKGWLNAENLAEGDRLRRADGGYATVLAVERVELAEPQEVYNFTVKGPHTYFVLSVGVLVHNTTCDPVWDETTQQWRDPQGNPAKVDWDEEMGVFTTPAQAENFLERP